MSNITATINIDDPVGGHQISQRLIGLATMEEGNIPYDSPGFISFFLRMWQ